MIGKRLLTALCLGLLFSAVSAPAIDMITVQLVRLSPRGSVTPGLESVAAIIQRNLPYAGCERIDQKTCVLPANATLVFRNGYQMALQSRESDIAVTITHNRRLLLSTAVRLKGNTPVIIGGFSAGTRNTRDVFVIESSKQTSTR